MVRKHMTVMATVALVMWVALPVSAQQALDARTVIAAASKASGYDNVNTIEFLGSGSEGNAIGQAQSQKGGWVQNQVKEYSRFIDLAAGTSQRNAITSRPLDATGQLPGGAGLGAASARPDTPNTATIAADASFPQRVEIILTPPGFLKLAATATNATVYNRNVGGKRYTVVSFPVADLAPSGVPYRVTGHINDQNLVEKVETAIDEAQASLLIGDLNIEQTFSGYKDFNGVKFPTSLVQTRGDVLWTRLDITDVKVNGTAPAPLAAGGGGRGGAGGGRGGAGAGRGGGAPGGGRGGPGGGGAAAGRGGGGRGGAPANAGPASRKVGDGIYVLTGGYRSMAVEFRDFIVFIEANQNAATTSAAIAEAKRLIPNKPIRYVINTHSHFDHSGGLRTAALEGATIVTHEMNKPLYEKWFTNPRTLAAGGPDDFEKSGKKAKFEYVSDKRVIKDDMNTVEIYHINGVVHGEDLMVVYMPKAKILFESDAFNAGAPDAPARTGDEIDGFERQFDSELERLRVDYQFIVPAHQPNPDREVTREEFRKRVGKS